MTGHQKVKRASLEKRGAADPASTLKSMKNLGEGLAKVLQRKDIKDVELWTDEHRSYPKAFQLTNNQGLFRHHRISSRMARTRQNPLFAVNYLDRQFRKDLSDHTRETVQFAHNPSCMMCRFVLYRHFHNYLKPYRIKDHRENQYGPYPTHADKAGLRQGYYEKTEKKYRQRRFFLNKLDLDMEEKVTWMLGWKNPGCVSGKYVPKYLAA